ncbi:hypothetical protein Ocin01_01237 [Orchesella cincta]|uniref:Gustatory receptor n=1 Tax=Orchesella cincta TaxID=48709 RepID=A0A1D2NK90_ORCCI|nr:hypothetical protein Ocin01_01237 [Orchesella cincta]
MDPEPSMTHQDDGQILETDLYGRRIASRVTVADGNDKLAPVPRDRRNSFEETIELTMGFARRLQDQLDSTKKGRRDSVGQPQQEVLTYAETLHNGLKLMWVPMVFLGRIPFRLVLKNNHAIIRVTKKHPTYIACLITCVLTWIIFLNISIGLLLLTIDSINEGPTTLKISKQIVKLYWPDLFIFWTTLLQTCISSTHILIQAERFALFIKAWYRVLDLTKIEVSRTLKKYIAKSLTVLVVFVGAVITMYFLPVEFPHIRGTGYVICIALAEPFIVLFKLDDSKTLKDGNLYFEEYAIIGLILYVIVILFSWLYIIQFMVFCRCFRKGLKSINQRIAMILCVNDEPRVGPNALRLTYEYIHKDYLGVATTGIKIGQIFSWTICNYYLWAILVMVVELGEIFKFAETDFRSKAGGKTIENTTQLLRELPPIQEVVNSVVHLLITVVCIFYVSHEGAGAHKEGKIGYELARYKGLVNCTTQLERNFIRSIWIIVTDKCQVHVSPGKFFGITYSTVLTVFATSFTFFVFYVQSTNLDDEADSNEAGDPIFDEYDSLPHETLHPTNSTT